MQRKEDYETDYGWKALLVPLASCYHVDGFDPIILGLSFSFGDLGLTWSMISVTWTLVWCCT